MEKIGSTIAKFRKEAKLSQGELAKRLNGLGFNPSAASISSWEKDVSIPNALQFLAVCKTLGIGDIYGEFIKEDRMNTDELHGLNEEGKKRAREYISLLLLSDEYRETGATGSISATGTTAAKETTETSVEPATIDITEQSRKRASKNIVTDIHETTRVLRLYNLPASAGTGEFLDGEDYEEVEVGNDVSAMADFGIRIKGNSMEPRYTDGQTVWIKRCEDLQDGEIGIFLLNGSAYCKKLKKDRNGISLISLNPDYKPIKISESDVITVFGKVLN